MHKFSHMEKRPEQSITSWIGDMKAQVHLMKVIDITLPELLMIMVLTSGLPSEYDSVIVALDAVKPDDLSLELAIVCSMRKSATLAANSWMTTRPHL